MIVILEFVVPVPIAESKKDKGFTTSFPMVELYLKLKVWVLSEVIWSSNSSFTDNPCCCPEVEPTETVTVPSTLLAKPDTFSLIFSILLSSPTLELIDVKNIWLVLNETFSVDKPIKSSLILEQ